jgi:hypothetical protein
MTDEAGGGKRPPKPPEMGSDPISPLLHPISPELSGKPLSPISPELSGALPAISPELSGGGGKRPPKSPRMTTGNDEADAPQQEMGSDPISPLELSGKPLPPISPELSGKPLPPILPEFSGALPAISPELHGKPLPPSSPELSGASLPPGSADLSDTPLPQITPELSDGFPAGSRELSGLSYPAMAQDAAEMGSDPISPLLHPISPELSAEMGSDPISQLLPPAYSESELRDAVGATPRSEPKPKRRRPPTPFEAEDDGDGDDGGPRKPRSRKAIFVSALSLFVGLSIAALVFLGRANSARYVVACEADQVVVEQGRSFPPWGTHALDGAEWKPLKIPPEAECHPRETEEVTELASWYLTMLMDQASTLLTAREVTKVDDAETQLKQALLVTRELARDDERRDKRKEIERLLGDVVYGRASAKLRTAADAMNEAAKQFDVAAAQRPRHASDAAAWAGYVRKLVEELRVGPSGAQVAFPPLPPPERPGAPTGVALPVEPERGSDGSASEPPPPAAPPPDAGIPTGGVLL